MNTKYTTIGQCRTPIPDAVWEVVEVEVGKVARRFYLNQDDRDDLKSEVKAQVRQAMAFKYDPRKGKPLAFLRGVVRVRILEWIRIEYRRREDFVNLAVERSRRTDKARLVVCSGRQDDVDDTSVAAEDRRDFGEELPERLPNEEKVADFTWQLDMLRVLLVRQVVSRLTGTSRQIRELYLRYGTLNHVFAVMRARRRHGLGFKRFFAELWPCARFDFKREWRETGKCFGLD